MGAKTEKKMVTEVFIEGARKGLKIGTSSIIPNILMAYVLISVLKISGLLDVLSRILDPLMAVFSPRSRGNRNFKRMDGNRRGCGRGGGTFYGRSSGCSRHYDSDARDLPFGSTDSIYWESAECGGRKKQALSAAFGNQYYQCYAWDAGYAYICIENRSGNNHPWAAPAAYYIQ